MLHYLECQDVNSNFLRVLKVWAILCKHSFSHSAGLLNNFLCCKSLVVFSRISYAVYLTQFAVFFYNVGSIRSSQQFSLLRSVSIFIYSSQIRFHKYSFLLLVLKGPQCPVSGTYGEGEIVCVFCSHNLYVRNLRATSWPTMPYIFISLGSCYFSFDQFQNKPDWWKYLRPIFTCHNYDNFLYSSLVNADHNKGAHFTTKFWTWCLLFLHLI